MESGTVVRMVDRRGDIGELNPSGEFLKAGCVPTTDIRSKVGVAPYSFVQVRGSGL